MISISKCQISSIALIVSLILFCSTSVSASSISSFETDAATGWSKLGTSHMGIKYTTYSFSSSLDESSLASCVSDGIDMWGSEISCTKRTSGAMGTIASSLAPSQAVASTTISTNSASHITAWTICIYELNFINKSNAGKARVIAHELGHAFGLGHVSNSSQIMYTTYNDTFSVTAGDIRGMRVMTHVHTHGDSYSISYEPLIHTHKKRCTTCKAYQTENCNTTRQWHEGTTHYYQCNCVCGNQKLVSKVCTDNQCIYKYQSIVGPDPEQY